MIALENMTLEDIDQLNIDLRFQVATHNALNGRRCNCAGCALHRRVLKMLLGARGWKFNHHPRCSGKHDAEGDCKISDIFGKL